MKKIMLVSILMIVIGLNTIHANNKHYLSVCCTGSPIVLDSTKNWYGPIVTGHIIYPAAYSIGNYTLTSGEDTLIVTIHPIPSISFNALPSIEPNTVLDLTPYVNIPVGIFNGKGITNKNYFDAKIAGAGIHMLTYTHTNQMSGCSISQVAYIEVK